MVRREDGWRGEARDGDRRVCPFVVVGYLSHKLDIFDKIDGSCVGRLADDTPEERSQFFACAAEIPHELLLGYDCGAARQEHELGVEQLDGNTVNCTMMMIMSVCVCVCVMCNVCVYVSLTIRLLLQSLNHVDAQFGCRVL
jgi:hypothetical protein